MEDRANESDAKAVVSWKDDKKTDAAHHRYLQRQCQHPCFRQHGPSIEPSPRPGEADPAPEDQARAKPRRVESRRQQERMGCRALPTATSPPLTMLPPATTIHPQSHRRRATTQAQQVSPLMLTSHQHKRMTSCLDHCFSRHACFDSTVLSVCSTARPGRAVSEYGGQSGIMLLPPPSLSSTWYCTADNCMVI